MLGLARYTLGCAASSKSQGVGPRTGPSTEWSTTFARQLSNTHAPEVGRDAAPLQNAKKPILNVVFKIATFQITICTRIR